MPPIAMTLSMADDYKDMPPLPPRYRLRDVIWGDNTVSYEDDRYVYLVKAVF